MESIRIIINAFRLVMKSKMMINNLVNMGKVFDLDEETKRAIAIGKFELYKERRTNALMNIGYYQDQNANLVFFRNIEKLNNNGYNLQFEMSGDEANTLYSNIILELEEHIKQNKRIK